MSGHAVRIGCAFCTPMPYVNKGGKLVLDTITYPWHRARMGLATPTNFNMIEITANGMEVGDARNKAAQACLDHSPNPEFLFFLDNDVIVPYDALTKLIYRARCFKDYEIFAGVYCCKWMSPPDPLIYADNGSGPYWDWTVGDILTTEGNGIKSVHMGLTLIKVSLFERMKEEGFGTEENPFFKTVNEKTQNEKGALMTRRGTEDIYFCNNAVDKCGAKILIDTGVLAPHIDKSTGVEWGLDWLSENVKKAKALYDQTEEYKEEKKALDLGAGTYKREWKGYKTYSTDIRPNVGVDYVQDTRELTLPDNHFDLVASSHHLEHLGRMDQEKVWSEMFRITKPGGLAEHIVPDVTWAANELLKENPDMGSVLNVFYGAQEAHGYERNFNTHYFAYTPEIAAELAKQAGFQEVQIANWKTDERLKYNMVIKAVKPGAKKAEEPKEVEEVKEEKVNEAEGVESSLRLVGDKSAS